MTRRINAWSATIVMLALTISAHHTDRVRVGVDGNDCVLAVGFAHAAEIFDALTGAVDTRHATR